MSRSRIRLYCSHCDREFAGWLAARSLWWHIDHEHPRREPEVLPLETALDVYLRVNGDLLIERILTHAKHDS